MAAGLLSASADLLADVANQDQYNDVLATGGEVKLINDGFSITGMPVNPIGGNVSITSTASGDDPLPVLNGNGGNWYAFTNFGSPFVLTSLSNVAIENFGRVGVNNHENTSTTSLAVDNVRFANNVNSGGSYDGGGFVTRYLSGVIDSTFINNRVTGGDVGGGAFAVTQQMTGGRRIEDSTFTNNHADGKGGAVYVADDIWEIADSVFIGNTAGGDGGAVYAADISAVFGSRFVGNSGTQGGAIYVSEGGLISGSDFIGNRTHANSANPSAHGGAMYVLGGDMLLTDSQFLYNHAQGGAAAGGLGGAVYHKHNGGAYNEVTIQRGTFYGNQHNPGNTGDAYNSIAFDGDATQTTEIAIDTDYESVWMLDPMASLTALKTTLSKTGDGDWNLGGVNTFVGESNWNIVIDALTLTTVQYGDGNPPVTAAVNLEHGASSFTLQASGALRGSGSIKANTITLNGTIAPSTIASTAVDPDHEAALSAQYLPGLYVAQTSPVGTLALDDNVTLSDAAYTVNVAADGQSQLNIIGDLTLGGSGNTVQLNITDDTVGALNNVSVLNVSGALNGSNNFTLDTSNTPAFLRVTGGAVNLAGNALQISMDAPTLAWHDTAINSGSGKSESHGNFHLNDWNANFTVTQALADRDDVSAAGGSHSGWDGKSLTKTGTNGILFLNGANTYTGLTSVQGGALVVGATANDAAARVSGAVQVTGFANFIGGHGLLAGGLTLDPSAIVAPGGLTPGAYVGTLTVNGDVDFNNASYYLDINPDNTSDKLVVKAGNGQTGKVTLTGGELQIYHGGGAGVWADNSTLVYSGIIEAEGGVEGEFDDIYNDLLFLKEKVVYNDTSVDLHMTRVGSGSDSGSACTWCASGNQGSVFRAIGSLPATHAVAAATMGMTDPVLGRAAMDNLSGEIYGSVRSALLGNTRLRGMVQARMQGLGRQELAAAPVMLASNGAAPRVNLNTPSQRLWVNTWAYDGDTKGSRNAAKTDQSGIGLALGGDVRVADGVTVGAMFGYEDGKVKNGGTRRSRTDVDAYSLGGYATADLGGVELQGGLIYSHMKLDANRTITVPGLAGKARASYDGYKVQAFLEAGLPLELGEATVTPYASLTQSWLHTDAAREKGSAAALRIGAQNDSVMQTTLGLRAAYQLPTAAPVALTAHLGWAHAFGDTKAKTSNRFGTSGSRFAIEGNRMDRDRALIGVGIEAQLAPNATLAVGYDGQFGSKTKDHAGSVQVRVRF